MKTQHSLPLLGGRRGGSGSGSRGSSGRGGSGRSGGGRADRRHGATGARATQRDGDVDDIGRRINIDRQVTHQRLDAVVRHLGGGRQRGSARRLARQATPHDAIEKRVATHAILAMNASARCEKRMRV